MHYQMLSRPPLSALSPNSPSDHRSAQRSSPTCSLSLTSVSASGTAGTIDNTSCSAASGTDAAAMLVDSCSTSLVTVSPTAQPKPKVPVPFPKRPHSLLRSTASSHTSRVQQPSSGGMSSIPFATQETETDDDVNNAQDTDDHPRKRTRTSAFSVNRIQLWRTQVASELDPSTAASSLKLYGSRTAKLPPRPPSKDLRHSSSHSHSKKPSVPDFMTLLTSLTSQSRSFPLAGPKFNAFNRGRRAHANDLKHHLNLYRTLVHELERKYLSQPEVARKISSPCGTLGSTSSPRRKSCPPTSTPPPHLDHQDALLAHHLRTYLLLNGTDIEKLLVNAQPSEENATENHQLDQEGVLLPSTAAAAAPSGQDDHAAPMDVDEDSSVSKVHPPSTSADGTEASSNLPSPAPVALLSYPHLVANLILRRFEPPKVPLAKAMLVRYPRARSALAAGCITLNSY
ncbi:hypothetical protein CPB84DRAFT_1849028 [Gymnopilus junonius]|uniref:Uncharacterized protein n=1 Tax=Gymnopilus junonius TaxID=109634 RepID=A0A9P5TLV5_GYMJU|nr:hypothetical protein CPB84DRAFT_1849028 [Gymnopilus junonius]